MGRRSRAPRYHHKAPGYRDTHGRVDVCHGIDEDDGDDEESLRAQMCAPNQANTQQTRSQSGRGVRKRTPRIRGCLLCDCYSDPRG